MSYRKLIKIFLVSVLLILGLYLVFAFSFGGFGTKPPAEIVATKKDRTLLFAHRGLAGYYPENSCEGVKGAREYGLSAVEIDIRRSVDGELIVFHDEDCVRLLGLNREINTLTTAEIKKHPIFLDSKESSSFVPTLIEMYKTQNKNMVYYLDLKLSSFKDADDIISIIKNNHAEKTSVLANWDIFFIFYVEANYPEIMTALEGFDAGKEWTYGLMPKNLKPDFLSGFYQNTNEDHINWLKKNDLMSRRIIYGVTKKDINTVLKSGFKNVIMDYDINLDTNKLVRPLLNL